MAVLIQIDLSLLAAAMNYPPSRLVGTSESNPCSDCLPQD
jgi:hypothetical protein